MKDHIARSGTPQYRQRSFPRSAIPTEPARQCGGNDLQMVGLTFKLFWKLDNVVPLSLPS